MHTKIALHCIMLLLFISHSIELLAFQKEPKYQEGTPVDSAFDIALDKLPANYTGQDIIALYNKLRKTVPAKDEFETTAQYAARLKSSINDDVYAFKIQANHVVYFSYDADKESLTAEIKAPLVTNHGINPSAGTEAYKDADSLSIRVVAIKSDLLESYEEGVAISNLPHSIYDGMNSIDGSLNSSGDLLTLKLKITIPMKPDVARQTKPNLATLLICKLKNITPSESLTFWFPEKVGGTVKLKEYIVVRLEAIWIYDTSTGQILKKEQIKK